MFWTEEDVQPAVDLAVKLFGPNNQYHYDKNTHKNIHIMTREFGKIWFGDLKITDEVRNNLENLSVTINQTIYLLTDHENLDQALYKTSSKLRELLETDNYK